jgi:hypothetical protein
LTVGSSLFFSLSFFLFSSFSQLRSRVISRMLRSTLPVREDLRQRPAWMRAELPFALKRTSKHETKLTGSLTRDLPGQKYMVDSFLSFASPTMNDLNNRLGLKAFNSFSCTRSHVHRQCN